MEGQEGEESSTNFHMILTLSLRSAVVVAHLDMVTVVEKATFAEVPNLAMDAAGNSHVATVKLAMVVEKLAKAVVNPNLDMENQDMEHLLDLQVNTGAVLRLGPDGEGIVLALAVIVGDVVVGSRKGMEERDTVVLDIHQGTFSPKPFSTRSLTLPHFQWHTPHLPAIAAAGGRP